MTLALYRQNSWIRDHTRSPQEITALLEIADRDIAQSQTPGLGAEWRFNIAYNAALQLATAALAASGFQAERQNKHQRTIECLAFTIALPASEVTFLDACRRKRHTQVYDRIGAISDQEADELTEFATHLRADVARWLDSNHPDLVESN